MAPFLGLTSFVFALALTRHLGLFFWGDATHNASTVLFFFGNKNGQQIIAYLFYSLTIPTFTLLWWRLSVFLLDRKPKFLFLTLCVIIQAVVVFPLLKPLILIYSWILTALVLAGSLVWLHHKRKQAFNLDTSVLLWLSLPLLYFWIYNGWHPPFVIDFYNEGSQLGPAQDFLAGKIPYRDIFIDQGLIHNVLKPAFSFLIFGVSVAAKKLFDSLTLPFGYIGLAILGWKVLKQRVLWFFLIFTLPLMFPQFSDRLFFSLLSVTALTSYVETREEKWVWLSGFLTGLQIFTSLEIGVFSAAVALGYFFLHGLSKSVSLKTTWHVMATWFKGSLLGAGPILIYLTAKGGVVDFFWVSYMRLFLHTKADGIPFMTLPLPFEKGPLLWYLPLLIQFAGLAYLSVRWRELHYRTRWMGALLWLASATHFYPALVRCDTEYLGFSSPLSYLLGLWLLDESAEFKMELPSRWIYQTLLGGMGFLVLFYLAQSFSLDVRVTQAIPDLVHKVTEWGPYKINLSQRLNGVELDPDRLLLTQKIQEWSKNDEPVVNLTTEGGVFFTANRKNLTRYYNGEVIYSLAMEKEVVREIEESLAPLIVTQQGGEIKNRLGRHLTELEEIIRRDFYMAWSNQRISLWKRIRA